MKHLIKTSLWLLAFMAAGGMLVSCVEEEQEPDFSEAGGSTSAKIDVKMPAPGYGAFYAGSEVLLKGSDFSGRDEVYMQRATYHYNEDTEQEEYVTDGPKVRAEVTDYTSTELTFLVPGEVVQGYGTTLVLFKRGGKEYLLGRMEISPFPVDLEMHGPLMEGELAYLRSYNPEFTFGNDDKVFLQKCVEQNGSWVGVGEKIKAKVESINSSELCFVIPQQITGEVLVILEHNGFASALNDYFVVESFMSYVFLEDFSAIINQNVNLLFRGAESFFTDTDKVYLRPVEGGDKVEATITYRDGNMLSFKVPDLFNGTSGNAFVILEHYGTEYQLDDLFVVESFIPYVSLENPYAVINQNANLTFHGTGSFFTDTDKVYLRPVEGGDKVEATITYRDGSMLSFRVPDLFNGASGDALEAFIILKHYGAEYQLNNTIIIFRTN